MKKDIQSRADIDGLMKQFYARAMNDEIIGRIFTDAAKLDLEHHLPIIGDFWETLILGANNYRQHGRNPLLIHALLNLKTPLGGEHFRRWLDIFKETIDESFAGERAESAKTRAAAIAARMQNFIGQNPPIETYGWLPGKS